MYTTTTSDRLSTYDIKNSIYFIMYVSLFIYYYLIANTTKVKRCHGLESGVVSVEPHELQCPSDTDPLPDTDTARRRRRKDSGPVLFEDLKNAQEFSVSSTPKLYIFSHIACVVLITSQTLSMSQRS